MWVCARGALCCTHDAVRLPGTTPREFEQLRDGVVSLWEQLDAPPDEIVSFLSECDLVAPYHPRVLDLYRTLFKEMSEGPAVPPPAPTPAAAAPRRASTRGGAGAIVGSPIVTPAPAPAPAGASGAVTVGLSVSGHVPKSHAALFDSYRSDVTSRLYPAPAGGAGAGAGRRTSSRPSTTAAAGPTGGRRPTVSDGRR